MAIARIGVWVAGLLLATGTGTLWAQSNTEGAVFGRVMGPAAGEFSGGTASLVSSEIGLSRVVSLSPAGTFELSGLPVGSYTISVKLPGYDAVDAGVRVRLGLPTTVLIDMEAPSVSLPVELARVVVTASAESPVNVSATEIGLNLHALTLRQLPVAHDLTSVALLAPGVIRGDTGFFGNLASFSGASVAENAYYLNGFNLTGFRRGLDFSKVPFEFFQDVQIKTTGYSAEFGRSIGGVINTVSQRGTNELRSSLSVYWEPRALRASSPNSFRSDGTLHLLNDNEQEQNTTVNLSLSGAIIPNRLFFHALHAGRSSDRQFMTGTNQLTRRSIRDPLWAGRLDWQLAPDHAFEYTILSDRNTTIDQRFDHPVTAVNGVVSRPAAPGADLGSNYMDRGGMTHIGRYTGVFAERLHLSLLAGRGAYNRTDRSDVSEQPYIVDQRTTTQVLSGTRSVSRDFDVRKAYRLDGTYTFTLFGQHQLRFGYDLEDNLATSSNRFSGDINYNYLPYTGGPLANGATPPAGTTDVVESVVYRAGGEFRVINEAFYLEDAWKLFADRLTLNLGVRGETFDNRNAQGLTFIKIDNQWAPRFSGAWDPRGDGRSKFYAGFGRHFLQIPANTNVRMSGGETLYYDYHVLNGVNPDGTPVMGSQIGNRLVVGTGVVPDVTSLVDANISPMYQDEFSLGYERALGRKWKIGIAGIYRDLREVVEDGSVDPALFRYAQDRGYTRFQVSGFDWYVLGNPGRDVTIQVNLDQDVDNPGQTGVPDGVVNVYDNNSPNHSVAKQTVTLTAADLGYPRATRQYYAAHLTLDRVFDGKWFANFSYVWAHSYGNYEGMVTSDTGQRDAGMLTLFDQPGLVDGTYGNLPNDRRHTFKVHGGWQVSPEWFLSGSASVQSGRPISAIGLHPTDFYARLYGPYSHYENGVLVPRGSRGRTPWVHNVDLGVRYRPSWGDGKLTFGLDLFNALGRSGVLAVYERVELATGAADTRYRSPRVYQTPRYVRLSLSLDY